MPRALLTAILALSLGASALADEAVPEPSDYRMEDYRAPVPETLLGAIVVSTEEAHALWEQGTVAFVDVMPQAPRPAGLPKGTIWRERPRDSIPGAIWLPNVGYGALHESIDSYFRAGLEAATEGDLSHPVLIFCLIDCWMSWNAAKRALSYGYVSVYWYPDGTDGWDFEGFPLERVPPFASGAKDG